MKRDVMLFRWYMCILVCVVIFPSLAFAISPSPRRNISAELRWGYYVPDTNKWEESAYGRMYAMLGGVKLNLELFRQFIQLGGGIGYMREHDRKYYLYNIPLEASLNIRLKFSPQQLIVPYFGGGVDYSYFKEKGRFQDPNGPKETSITHNSRTGYHANAGIQVLLNRLAPSDASWFDQKFGVNATYLTFEARYTDLSNFGEIKDDDSKKADVSGWIYYMGILMEF